MSVHRFRSMGCEVVVGGATERELAAVEALFDRRDATFSRFRPDSELSRVNAAPGEIVAVSPEFARALRHALYAAERTDWLVDPTVGAAVAAAGYTKDFSQLTPDPSPAGAAPAAGRHALHAAGSLVRRPSGVLLDLNGVVKSLAVDDALALLAGDGFVSAGGDVAARGACVVGLPGGEAVSLLAGAIATSGTATRRWLRGGTWQHHLIDPATGRPSRSRWTHATVVAGTCVDADVAAKAAFLLDGDGPAWLDGHGLAGRFVDADGAVVRNAAWARSLEARETTCT